MRTAPDYFDPWAFTDEQAAEDPTLQPLPPDRWIAYGYHYLDTFTTYGGNLRYRDWPAYSRPRFQRSTDGVGVADWFGQWWIATEVGP
jgi:hypothetical protein